MKMDIQNTNDEYSYMTEDAGGISRSRSCFNMNTREFLRKNVISLLLLVGVICGILVGVTLKVTGVDLNQKQVAYLRFPGELFLQMMKMVMIPVVVSSLLTATADIDVRTSGKISLRALVYYLITFVIASLLGVVLCVSIKPGKTATVVEKSDVESKSTGSPLFAFMDLLRNMIPDNPVEACFTAKSTTEEIEDQVKHQGLLNSSGYYNDTQNSTSISYTGPGTRLVVNKVPGVNMIGLVVVAMITGSAISYIGPPAKPVYDFFLAVRLIVFQLVRVFMWYAPIGIGFLLAETFATLPNLQERVHNLMVFGIAHFAGLVIHAFIILPMIYLAIVRRNPYAFIRNVVPAMILAFGSESSGVTLPMTIRCLEEKNKVDRRITQLIASVGATVNMDGGCLFFTMLTIFIAQLEGITMNIGQLVTTSLLAMTTAAGIGCVPGGHIVFMTMIPAALHLPTHNVSLLFATDWILSRCRTVVNVLGDCFGAGIVESLSFKELSRMESESTHSANSQNEPTALDRLMEEKTSANKDDYV